MATMIAMSNAPKLTKAQKDQIVMALMSQAGNLAEFWGEMGLADVPFETGVAYLASLMRRMPGDAWDTRLPGNQA